MSFRHGATQSCVAFVFCNSNGANITDKKISTGNSYFSLRIFLSQFLPCYQCQLFRRKIWISSEFLSKKLCNIFLAFMHSWCYNMIRRFAIQLLNVFSQVCFHTFNTSFFHEFIQVNFFRHHTLTLHQYLAIFICTDLTNNIQGLLGILGP